MLLAFKSAARSEADSGGSWSHRWHFPTSAPRHPRSLCSVPSHLIPRKCHAAARSACLCNQTAANVETDPVTPAPPSRQDSAPPLAATRRQQVARPGHTEILLFCHPLPAPHHHTCPVEQITARTSRLTSHARRRRPLRMRCGQTPGCIDLGSKVTCPVLLQNLGDGS